LGNSFQLQVHDIKKVYCLSVKTCFLLCLYHFSVFIGGGGCTRPCFASHFRPLLAYDVRRSLVWRITALQGLIRWHDQQRIGENALIGSRTSSESSRNLFVMLFGLLRCSLRDVGWSLVSWLRFWGFLSCLALCSALSRHARVIFTIVFVMKNWVGVIPVSVTTHLWGCSVCICRSARR